MKKVIAVVSLSLLAASAFAGKPGHPGGHDDDKDTGPAIYLDGKTVQVTSLSWSAVSNKAQSGGDARQNISSNTGNVNVGAPLTQLTFGTLSYIGNKAESGGDARQNLATNVGKVDIAKQLTQVVALKGSAVMNHASSGSSAVQNISTNNGCQTCQ
ncbi:hypothetical protein [Comamonas terrigena]|uniref:hypothetical protein n=1 Tax=Comamonas terrigena TaxID=32013 RepID=UPI00244A2985|nr:hypothetical protein [Comamonas terrigena]MDH1700676.1 hypothetical protein [Comamonas terrigena]